LIYIKICGITEVDDAVKIAELGVNALGFIFYPKSKRYISPDKAKEIIDCLPPFINTVGVFVNEKKESVIDVLNRCPIDILQFHGDETPEYCRQFDRRIIKVFRVNKDFSFDGFFKFPASAFLLDSLVTGEYGGTGVVFDWDVAVKAKKYGKIILSGGLNPENLSSAVAKVNPYGVDISSGVEIKPGKKDISKVKEIVKICNFF